MEFFNSTNQILLYPLPKGWRISYCVSTKRYYYVNIHTNKIQWNRPTAPAPQEYPMSIRCSRILIKHNESDYYPSRFVIRTKKEAAKEISKCYALITTNQFTFEEVAYKYSDCPSGRRGGDIHWLNIHNANPYFLMAFNLDVGDLTLPIETPEGYEIFMRTG